MKTVLSALVGTIAATARAATQTGHVTDSALFAWWWATTAVADHKVHVPHPSRQRQVMKRVLRVSFTPPRR
jgi:hypothetical protein